VSFLSLIAAPRLFTDVPPSRLTMSSFPTALWLVSHLVPSFSGVDVFSDQRSTIGAAPAQDTRFSASRQYTLRFRLPKTVSRSSTVLLLCDQNTGIGTWNMRATGMS